MFHKIQIAKKAFDYSYAWDYSFACIDGAAKDLEELAKKLEAHFIRFDLVQSFGVPHIRLYSDIAALSGIK